MFARKVIGDIRYVSSYFFAKGIIWGVNPLNTNLNTQYYVSCHTENAILSNALEYQEEFKQLYEQRQYICQLADGGLIRGFYSFNRNGTVLLSASLSYLPNPGLVLDEDLSDDYIIVDDSSHFGKYLRIDLDTAAYEEIIHPHVHITFGLGSKSRIALDRFPLVSEFIAFILFLHYPKEWEKLCNAITSTAALDFPAYIRKKLVKGQECNMSSSLTDVEKSHYLLKL
jgi:hypothetical protein